MIHGLNHVSSHLCRNKLTEIWNFDQGIICKHCRIVTALRKRGNECSIICTIMLQHIAKM